MNVFAYALAKVRNEDETPEILDLARQLRAKYDAEKRGRSLVTSARHRRALV